LSFIVVKRSQSRSSLVEGAKPSEMPGFIKPQLATLTSPQGEQWLHEIKFDGYRIQVRVNNGKRRVFTHNGLDWTKRFSVISGSRHHFGRALASELRQGAVKEELSF
jgi:ATP-dependent DNA ligase